MSGYDSSVNLCEAKQLFSYRESVAEYKLVLNQCDRPLYNLNNDLWLNLFSDALH